MPIHVVLVFVKCENNPSYNRESSRHFTLTSANQRGEFSVCGTERGRFPGVKRNESFLKGHFTESANKQRQQEVGTARVVDIPGVPPSPTT